MKIAGMEGFEPVTEEELTEDDKVVQKATLEVLDLYYSDKIKGAEIKALVEKKLGPTFDVQVVFDEVEEGETVDIVVGRVDKEGMH